MTDHLFRRHGVRPSRSAVQRLCVKLSIRLYRPTYRYRRGDRPSSKLVTLGMKRTGVRWRIGPVGPFVEFIALADGPEGREHWTARAA